MEHDNAFELFTRGRNLFITGPGGTGKTTLVHRMSEYLNNENIEHKLCAMTGCAALLLGKNVSTFHSWSGIGLGKGTVEDCIKTIKKNKFTMIRIQKTRVLFVDEISMMSKKLFDIFYNIVKYINPRLQIIFTGDFFQLPPVGSSTEPDTSAFCFESEHWNEIFPPTSHIQLTHIYRQSDSTYVNILQSIRVGTILPEHTTVLNGKIEENLDSIDLERTGGVLPPRIYPLKRQVDNYNYMRFSELTEEIEEFNYQTVTNLTTYVDSGLPLKKEIIQKCNNLSPAAQEYEFNAILGISNGKEAVKLRVGCMVMLTRNLDLDHGLCNGSQGIVVGFTERKTPIVKFKDLTIPIGYQTFQSENYPTLGVMVLPLILSWAVTIHKIQGATLDTAIIDLGSTVFEYGQAYVGLSRVKSLEGLFLEGFNPRRIKANPKVIEFYNSRFC
jgi:ATP-dependent DNA helicase PIF1